MYLGEILRNMLIHFIDCDLLFSGWSTKTLNTHYAIDTSFLSFVEAAIDTPSSSSSSSTGLSAANQAVKDLIVRDLAVDEAGISEADIELVKWAVQAVGGRAAQMSACAIACIVEHTADDEGADPEAILDVGIDGSCVLL
jgi:hexokinase